MIQEHICKKEDSELYSEFLLGNKESFNILMIKHRKALTKFIMYYTKNTEMAEDIAQDSFLYMLVHKKEYDFKYSFKTYLYTIAKSRTVNYLKKENRNVPLHDEVIENFESELNVEDELINKENRVKVKTVIKKLKKDYQVIIYLYYFQNFKYKEISEILNISMSKTKMSLKRAKKIMEKNLKEGEKDDDR